MGSSRAAADRVIGQMAGKEKGREAVIGPNHLPQADAQSLSVPCRFPRQLPQTTATQGGKPVHSIENAKKRPSFRSAKSNREV
jgi:hypothetical protein